jgi:hypothetical protein
MKRRQLDRNVCGKRPALSFATKRAMTDLNWRKRRADFEANAATQTTTAKHGKGFPEMGHNEM